MVMSEATPVVELFVMRPAPADSAPPGPRQDLRRFEILLFVPWAVGTLYFSALVVGPKLFLVYLYGWTRVWQEDLRIVTMRKAGPWLVSNGDWITEGHFVHFLISAACWLVLFFATYPLLRLLLPRVKRRGA
jgi:hypothetical protein